MKMYVSLRIGHFDTRLAAETIDAQPDLGADLQGIRSSDIEPEIDVKCERVVAESFEGDDSGRFLQDVRLRLERACESAQDQLCRGAISNPTMKS